MFHLDVFWTIMLVTLTIENYALIDKLELSPSNHLNIITGETGAGKSIMLGAVGLLLGNRADTRVLSDSTRKCIIEGTFDIAEYDLTSFFVEKDLDYDSSIIIRREISVSGKSRAFVNDTPVLLDTLNVLGDKLMDIHSQNDTQLLGSINYQLRLIDDFAGTKTTFNKFELAYNRYYTSRTHFDKLKEEENNIRNEYDYNNFLLEELSQAELQASEQHLLEEELKTLENAEEIKSQLHDAMGVLSEGDYSALNSLSTVQMSLKQLAKYSDKFAELGKRIESILIDASDVTRELERLSEEVEHNPMKITETQDRLSLIYNLQQKHRVNSNEELLKIQEDLVAKSDKYYSLDEDLKRAEEEFNKHYELALSEAKKLSHDRQEYFSVFTSRLEGMLKELEITNARVEIQHEIIDLSKSGIDKVSILFSANKGVEPQPIKNVASGGEFSRFMFCVKYLLAGKTSLPTIIFDEIDTGVSGEVALKLGVMMREMSKNHQVLAISHLPQIAAKADKHFFVYKDEDESRSVSRIRELQDNERVEEIAKMIAGKQITSSALSSAKELMTR